jgi:cell division protein FtsN
MSAKPIGRDYKRTRRNGFDFGRWRDFIYGLACGLAIALVIFIVQRQSLQKSAPASVTSNRPVPRSGDARPPAGDDPDAETPQQFDFYDRLPNFEVIVPEKEGHVQRGLAGAPIERPGTYVLQAGSYRSQSDAERIRAQLAIQGVTAAVQRVAVDADVWHRVRIGPSSDLTEVNRLREKLRSADLDAIVIRVGD